MAEDSAYHGWQDDSGDAMFIADGPKRPLLVRVTQNGAQEHVLAEFASADSASEFQEWFDRSFEETALANQQLSLHVRGVPLLADQREEEPGYRPGLVDDE